MDEHEEITEAELAALADGTVAPERRDELLRRVESSPDLARQLADQRMALAAIHQTDDVTASADLHARIAALAGAAQEEAPDASSAAPWALERNDAPRPGRWRASRWLRWAPPAAAAVAAVVVALVIVLPGGGGSGPNVTEAARVALAPTSGAPPQERAGTRELSVSVDGVSYPYWADETSWRAVGTRVDVVDQRTITTVAYANDRGQRIGYAIAAGDALPVSGGRTVTSGGVRFRILQSDGATVVTWLRDGHTCVVAARGVDPQMLLNLASGQSA